MLNKIKYLGLVIAATSLQTQAGTMGPIETTSPGKIYFGIYGGGGSSNHMSTDQYGTAFFTEAVGGPLAVDSFGHAGSRSVGMIGGQLGFQWNEVVLSALNSQSSLTPAFELEGYYLGKSTFTSHDINNDTTRLDEHDFLVTYPTSTGVFLTNAVLNLNFANNSPWHPYVGAGIGAAIMKINDADSLQVSPPEANVNHYNANDDATAPSFAAQIKAGLNYDLTAHASIFAEYRGLYIADTDFTFGSTVYPTHAATSSWTVNWGHQYYNMGAVGLRVTV